MSGHSKWATIKRKKEKTDSQRASVFTKVTREIIVAAKAGGGEPEHNFRLRLAIAKAKEVNMPNDNIQRAIKRGIGQAEGDNYEEVFYEGYGAGGVALLVQALTDNRNRTASDLRYIFSRNHGNLGEAGCVAWMFETKGLITLETAVVAKSEEELFELVTEAGAEDFQFHEELVEITTDSNQLETVRQFLDSQKLPIKSGELSWVPQNTIEVTGESAQQLLKLIEALEDNDDVQMVYTNADIPDNELE